MKNEIEKNDIVILKNDIGKIKKGTQGTVVYDYGTGDMFEVEFFDDSYNTISVEKIFKDDIIFFQ